MNKINRKRVKKLLKKTKKIPNQYDKLQKKIV